jgi:peroxin-19
VLSEFNPPTKSSAPPNASSGKSGFGRKRTNTRVDQPPVSIPGSGVFNGTSAATDELDEAALSDEFARELAKNMEELMKELVTEGESSAKSGGPETEEDKEKEAQRIMKAAWEAMLVEGMNGITDEGGSEDNSASRSEGPSNSGDFQSKIKQTMDKLKESESNLKVCLNAISSTVLFSTQLRLSHPLGPQIHLKVFWNHFRILASTMKTTLNSMDSSRMLWATS